MGVVEPGTWYLYDDEADLTITYGYNPLRPVPEPVLFAPVLLMLGFLGVVQTKRRKV